MERGAEAAASGSGLPSPRLVTARGSLSVSGEVWWLHLARQQSSTTSALALCCLPVRTRPGTQCWGVRPPLEAPDSLIAAKPIRLLK